MSTITEIERCVVHERVIPMILRALTLCVVVLMSGCSIEKFDSPLLSSVTSTEIVISDFMGVWYNNDTNIYVEISDDYTFYQYLFDCTQITHGQCRKSFGAFFEFTATDFDTDTLYISNYTVVYHFTHITINGIVYLPVPID